MHEKHSTTKNSSNIESDDANGRALVKKIKAWGQELGFSSIGIARTDVSVAAARLDHWLDLGRHGDMDYMIKHRELRAAPALVLPATRSVITASMAYRPQTKDDASVLADDSLAYISRYALGRDYHKTVRQRLQHLNLRIEAELKSTHPGLTYTSRVFSDSAPVMEVEFAVQSGIAWRGKHTLALSRTGSWQFLGEIYTSLDLPADSPNNGHCGTCTRCIESCPTAAIVAPYEVDARRCISYLTIELHGSIPVELRPLIGNRIYGCDDCQICCPWNRFARLGDPDFGVRQGLDAPKLIELFAWDTQKFEQNLAGSPIRRIGHERWLRNIAVALGNATPAENIRAALQTRLEYPSALVREHVAWGLSRISETARSNVTPTAAIASHNSGEVVPSHQL